MNEINNIVENNQLVHPEEKEEPKVETIAAFKEYDVIVTAVALKLHEQPNHNSEVVRVVKEGVILTVTAERNGYLNVGNAWASKKFVKRK